MNIPWLDSPIGFNAARGFVGGATFEIEVELELIDVFQCRTRLCGWCNENGAVVGCKGLSVSMPHAALWVVQQLHKQKEKQGLRSFNAARGFVGGATWCARPAALRKIEVSMPHAALWVVQQGMTAAGCLVFPLFQCRTRLCGWCNRIARSPCPPKRKKAFWKVSGNLRCLTENM